MPTFTSMQEKGEPDVAPEFWANAAIIALNKAVDEGKMHTLNKAPITGLVKDGGYYLTLLRSIQSLQLLKQF